MAASPSALLQEPAAKDLAFVARALIPIAVEFEPSD